MVFLINDDYLMLDKCYYVYDFRELAFIVCSQSSQILVDVGWIGCAL